MVRQKILTVFVLCFDLCVLRLTLAFMVKPTIFTVFYFFFVFIAITLAIVVRPTILAVFDLCSDLFALQ